jgi:hypothetical protein
MRQRVGCYKQNLTREKNVDKPTGDIEWAAGKGMNG